MSDNTCPAGYDLRSAFAGMACNNCGCQCIIRKLKIRIQDLEEDILTLKRKL